MPMLNVLRLFLAQNSMHQCVCVLDLIPDKQTEQFKVNTGTVVKNKLIIDKREQLYSLEACKALQYFMQPLY